MRSRDVLHRLITGLGRHFLLLAGTSTITALALLNGSWGVAYGQTAPIFVKATPSAGTSASSAAPAAPTSGSPAGGAGTTAAASVPTQPSPATIDPATSSTSSGGA